MRARKSSRARTPSGVFLRLASDMRLLLGPNLYSETVFVYKVGPGEGEVAFTRVVVEGYNL